MPLTGKGNKFRNCTIFSVAQLYVNVTFLGKAHSVLSQSWKAVLAATKETVFWLLPSLNGSLVYFKV